jgi:NitT/TauT family transport system ATP-binding protein
VNTILDIEGLSKAYRDRERTTEAIGRVDFSVHEHEFVTVVGPSGCGKTTLLLCVMGLLAPTAGRAVLRGRPIESPPREMAIVFQDYSRSLFPWLSVKANVGLPLRRDTAASARNTAVAEALAAVGLSDAADHYPWQLSGGMQQRVAIARALAYRPSILLLDEPFASVDAQTRAELEDLVLDVRQRYGVTTLLVTHDIDESVYMSDRIVILTKRPSTVQETLDVTLPYPRDQASTKEHHEFVSTRAHVYRAITQAHAGVDTATRSGASVPIGAAQERTGGEL